MPLISVSRLQKVYGDESHTIGLKDVSFEIDKGEFVAIMGPSGSGKSTLLHILGFLDMPTGGDYVFKGKNLREYSQNEIAQVRNQQLGFVFQSFNLLPRTTVLENVKLPLVYSKIPEEQWETLARNAIESVGLTHRIDHEPSQLSGGEKQRVAIARALVTNPDVIFADEPTGNLDSKSGRSVMETIQHLNEHKGHTIVLITHETATAEHASRIIHIKDGQVDREEKIVNRRRPGSEFSK